MTTRTRGRPPHADVLTPAEWRVLHGVQHGFTNEVMASRLGVSVDAIKYHVRNILQKLNIPSKKVLQRTLVRSTQQKPISSVTVTTGEETTMTTPTTLTGIGQIARTVSNCEQSRNWYELVLELPHLYSFGTLSFFDCGGTRLMLTQNEKLNPNESILYFRVADLNATYTQLQNKGAEFISAPHMIHQHEDGTQEWMAFLKDPDGRPLGLMSQVK